MDSRMEKDGTGGKVLPIWAIAYWINTKRVSLVIAFSRKRSHSSLRGGSRKRWKSGEGTAQEEDC